MPGAKATKKAATETPEEIPQVVQERLLPDIDIPKTFERIALTALPKDEELVGKPDDTLLSLVKLYGVVVPIMIVKRSDGRLIVAGGRRRIKAARKALQQDIPAEVWHTDEPVSHVLTIIENTARKSNVASEAQAVLAMAKAGMGHEDMVRATGLKQQQIDDYLRLGHLQPRLLEHFLGGRLALSTAKAVSRFPQENQERIAEVLRVNGKLKSTDIEAERVTIRAAAPQQEPLDFGAEPDVEEPEPDAAAADEDQFVIWLGTQVLEAVKAAHPFIPEPSDGLLAWLGGTALTIIREQYPTVTSIDPADDGLVAAYEEDGVDKRDAISVRFDLVRAVPEVGADEEDAAEEGTE